MTLTTTEPSCFAISKRVSFTVEMLSPDIVLVSYQNGPRSRIPGSLCCAFADDRVPTDGWKLMPAGDNPAELLIGSGR